MQGSIPPVSAPPPERHHRDHHGHQDVDAVGRIRLGSGIADGRDILLRNIVWAEIGRIKQQGRPLVRSEIVDAVWHRFQREADLTRGKGAGGSRWSIRDVERKVDYALRPSRLARVRPCAAKGFWTLNRKLTFKAAIDADQRLNGADRKTAWAMVQAVRDERDLSYLSSATSGSAARTARRDDAAVTTEAHRLRLLRGGQARRQAQADRLPPKYVFSSSISLRVAASSAVLATKPMAEGSRRYGATH